MKSFTTRLICFAALALGIASAETPYDITFYDNLSVGKTELKAGDYKVAMEGDKAVFTNGKKTIQIPATMGKADHEFVSTVFVSQHAKLREIDLGGTADKILFAQN